MTELALISAARWASLATGAGGYPTAGEWPLVAAAALAFIVLGGALLRVVGLSWYETGALTFLAPALLLVNVPLGVAGTGVAMLANAAGCVLPVAVALWIVASRRASVLPGVALLAAGIALAFVSSRVVPARGVLLDYQRCALGIGLFAALLFRASPRRAGALAFASAAIGTTIGADLLHLSELLHLPNTATITLGGAGLLDGILLTAVTSSAVAAGSAGGFQAVTRWRTWLAYVRTHWPISRGESDPASTGTR